MEDLSFYESIIFQVTGQEQEVLSARSASGGCINNGASVKTERHHFFIKWNSFSQHDFFEMEALGLRLLCDCRVIRIPEMISHGTYLNRQYLVLEHVETGAPSANFWEKFGIALARLHGYGIDRYGFECDNYIGKLPQKNNWNDSWIDFFIENRLHAQLGLASYHNLIDPSTARKFESLYAKLPGILAEEPPSLLHGDLWSGNYMVDHQGDPVLIDPAVYYGNREIELAFTKLFGGFDKKFYSAYQAEYPLTEGFMDRMDIYNLYPLLVHLNLFGTSYLGSIQQILRRYV